MQLTTEEFDIQVTLFDPPSGQIRGMATLFYPIKGKRKRVAHATLLVDGAPEISLEMPRRAALADLPLIAQALHRFHDRLEVVVVGSLR